MLSSIRRFSHTIFAKVFLFIIAIPFVFWGMGNIFSSGNQKVIVTIEKEKVSTQEFINHINRLNFQGENLSEEIFQQELTNFIAKNLINIESKRLNILLSDSALLKIIKKLNFRNTCFVHRDYHVSNLMKVGAKIGIIDNQDALIGNPCYDLVSLIDDVRIKTSKKLKHQIYRYYLTKAPKFYRINSSLSAERNSRFQHWYSNLGYQNFSASPVAIHDRHQ